MKPFNSITDWYFSKKALPFWLIFIIDCLVVFLTSLAVHALNNGTLHTLENFTEVCLTLSIYLLFFIIGFRVFHTYAGILRYASFIDLGRLALASLLAIVLAASFKYVWANDHLYPIRMRDIITWSALALVVMWLIRVIVKNWFDSTYTLTAARPIFIYGVQQGGVAIAKSIRSRKPATYRVAGFVTNDNGMPSYNLMGVKVYKADTRLGTTMKKHNAAALFVSPLASESLRNNTELVDSLIKDGIKIFMMPDEQEWTIKSITYKQLKEVDIVDLLPREQIQMDLGAIADMLQDKRIMITGAAGSIGSEIVRQVSGFRPAMLILVDQAETPLHDISMMMASDDYNSVKSDIILADISNAGRMRRIFEKHHPQFIFHAAAYKHVPMMEDNPAESIQNNIVGTKVLADLAVEYNTEKFVMVSTDKAVNPTNVMGCSKRICEMYVQSLDKAIKDGAIKGNTQFVTTRFGNVLGSNGSVVPLFKEQIKRGGPVTVTHPDIIRYFMLISEACQLVLEAGTMGNGGEIFVFDMGEPVKIAELAQKMIDLSGADIKIEYTGLRPGEKLYEELLNDEEMTLPTPNPKIKIAKVREYDYNDVNVRIIEMANNNYNDDPMIIVARMKQLVPEYKSQHSIFEQLDKDNNTESGC